MTKINYIIGDQELLPQMKNLWEKLQTHHSQVTKYFPENMNKFSFEKRTQYLFEKSDDLLVRINIVQDVKKNTYIGYCMSTILIKSTGKLGEAESLYVEPEYRHVGIGSALMEDAINWMDAEKVQRKILGVVVGNDDVFKFYKKFRFYPRTTIFEQKSNLHKK